MAANPQPPAGGDTSNIVPGLLGVTFFFVITLIAFGFRIYTRIRPTFRLTSADYILSIALLCELITFTSLLIAIHLGLGRYDYYLPPTAQINILKCLFPLGLFCFWASSLARMSIGSMLLRFEISSVWRVMLWILILIQLAMPIGADIFQLLQCRPIRAMWEPVPHAVCWSPGASQSFGYIYSGFGITSDLVFAIMPMFFIWSLSCSVLERTLVSILMALGLIAAIAGVMKLHTIRVWNPREATLRDWVPLLWWYRVEEIGLIAAACAPFLKPPIERALGRFGVTKFGFMTMSLPTIRSFQGGSAKDSSKDGPSILQASGEQVLQQNPGQAAIKGNNRSPC